MIYQLIIQYTEWKIIDTYQRVTRLPPLLLRVDRQIFVSEGFNSNF